MQYNIFINQHAVYTLGLQEKLDLTDLALFDFIYHAMNSTSIPKTMINGEEFYTIRHALVSQECPILRINHRDTFRKRMQKLCDAGLIERYENNQKENASLYKRGRLFSCFEFRTNTPADDYRHPADEHRHHLPTSVGTNIILNKHNNSSTTTARAKDEVLSDKERLFSWVTDNEIGLEQTLKQAGLLTHSATLEEMAAIVEPYVEDFYNNLQMSGKEDITTRGRSEVKSHFSSWLRKRIEIDRQQQNNNSNGNSQSNGGWSPTTNAPEKKPYSRILELANAPLAPKFDPSQII